MSRNLWWLLLRNFWLPWQKFYLWQEDWTPGPISTQFWDFSNSSSFLISQDPKSWVVPQLVRQLVYYYFYEKYQVPLHLWWTETFLKLWKVPNYYVQDCRSELFPWAHWLMLYSMFSLLFSRCAWSMIYHVLYTYNHGHNIWNKVKKSSKIEQEQKSLMTASA